MTYQRSHDDERSQASRNYNRERMTRSTSERDDETERMRGNQQPSYDTERGDISRQGMEGSQNGNGDDRDRDSKGRRSSSMRSNSDETNAMQRGPHSGRGPKGYKRSDERVLEDVSERLMQHGDIDASDIEVTVENGEVTLIGTVDSRWTKRHAAEIIDDMSGVHDVHNQLRVRKE